MTTCFIFNWFLRLIKLTWNGLYKTVNGVLIRDHTFETVWKYLTNQEKKKETKNRVINVSQYQYITGALRRCSNHVCEIVANWSGPEGVTHLHNVSGKTWQQHCVKHYLRRRGYIIDMFQTINQIGPYDEWIIRTSIPSVWGNVWCYHAFRLSSPCLLTCPCTWYLTKMFWKCCTQYYLGIFTGRRLLQRCDTGLPTLGYEPCREVLSAHLLQWRQCDVWYAFEGAKLQKHPLVHSCCRIFHMVVEHSLQLQRPLQQLEMRYCEILVQPVTHLRLVALGCWIVSWGSWHQHLQKWIEDHNIQTLWRQITFKNQNTSRNIHGAWHKVTETGIYVTCIHGFPIHCFIWKPTETMLHHQYKVEPQFLVALTASKSVKRYNSIFWYWRVMKKWLIYRLL